MQERHNHGFFSLSCKNPKTSITTTTALYHAVVASHEPSRATSHEPPCPARTASVGFCSGRQPPRHQMITARRHCSPSPTRTPPRSPSSTPTSSTPPKGAWTTAPTNELPRLGSILILDAEPGRGQSRRRCKQYQWRRWTSDGGEYTSDGGLWFRDDNNSDNGFVHRMLTSLMALGAGRLGFCQWGMDTMIYKP